MDSVLVRGFWGDIVNSPFIPLGVEVADEADRAKFFRQVNFQRVYGASDIAAYNVQSFIHRLERLERFEYPFERLKHVEQQYEALAAEDQKPDLEEAKQAEAVTQKLQAPPKTVDLGQVEEEAKMEAARQERHLLAGFAQMNVQLHLLSGSLDKLAAKKKFQGLFDLGVLSVHSANAIAPEVSVLFKDQARVHCETADFLLALKPEQRAEFRTRVRDRAKAARWTLAKEPPCSHHMLLTVHRTA